MESGLANRGKNCSAKNKPLNTFIYICTKRHSFQDNGSLVGSNVDLRESQLSVLIQALDELLLHHTVDSNVGQVRDEGVTDSSANVLTASEVQQSQRGETLQVGQTAVGKLTTAWNKQQRSDGIRVLEQSITGRNYIHLPV